jgi:hypothetical protein
MKKIFNDIYYRLCGLYYQFCDWKHIRKYKIKYPDYIEDEYNYGDLKHIWGVKSWDDLSSKECNLYTMNDIDITYNRDTKEYYLGIETAYVFLGDRKQGECKYLRRLLDAFTKFMDDSGYSKNEDYCLFMANPSITTTAKSIEELYTNFRIFVEGFCKLYEKEI